METGITKPQKTLILCSAFIAGAGVAFGGFDTYLFITLTVLLCVLLFSAARKFLSIRFAVFCLAIFLVSAVYTDFRTPVPDGLYSLAPRNLELKGQVVSEPRQDMQNKTKFYFKVNYLKSGGNWLPARAKTIVYIYDKKRKFENIRIGDIIELYGSVNPPYKATNPGEFDYGKFLNRKGVFTMTYVRYDNYKIIGDSGINVWFFLDKLNRVRHKILDIHRKHLDSPKLEILGGMVFGDRVVPAPEYVENSFVKSGLLHLLAASGMNVGIIFGIWFFLASRARVPFRVNIITGMLLVGLYSLLTGLPPSVTRATLMLEFVLVGKLLDRHSDNSTLLVMVCALMLLFNPLMICDVSFQFSFIVTLGLLMFVPLLVRKAKPIPEYLSGAFLVPFVAQVSITPVLAFHFNNFAPYSVLANMLVIPFVGIISFSGFLGSIFALIPFVGEKLCLVADKIAEPFIMLLLFVSDFISGLPGALQSVPAPEIIQITAFYILFLLLFACIKNNFSLKKLNIAAVVAFLVLTLLVFRGNFDFNKNLEFVFFDVGEGDSFLIKTPEKKYILVDTGPYDKYSPAKTAVVPYLLDKGITTLDIMLLTHPDSDHIGGAKHILKNIRVEKVFHNGETKDTKTFHLLKTYISRGNISNKVLNDGEEINIDNNLKITVIKPNNVDLKDFNEDGIMLYIVYKDFSALLMADCEADAMDIIKQKVKNPVDLLKVGHHGSYNSVNKKFLEYIKPEVSVISVGKEGYRQKHPHPLVIKLLKQFNSRLFRTARDFAVKITTEGREINYKTFKSGFFK